MGKAFLVAVLFMLVAIYLLLVVFSFGAGLAFVIAFPLGLGVMSGIQALQNKFKNVLFFQSNWFYLCLCLLILIPLAWNTYLDLRSGYFAGDYTAYECAFCGEPANGGVFLSGREEMSYYCVKDFEEVQQRLAQMREAATEKEVWDEAKMIVEKRLKSPTTAQFCAMSEATITKKIDTWTISGYVDAENSFGAMLRNNFTIIITFTDSTHYTIDKCSITNTGSLCSSPFFAVYGNPNPSNFFLVDNVTHFL